MDISVIVVNYNTGDLIRRCVESVLEQQHVDFELIVVDNASHDQSIQILEEYEHIIRHHPSVVPVKAGTQPKIKLIKSLENLGFGRANNLAAQYASGKFLYLLNPDAYLLEKHALRRLVDFLKGAPQFGAVGTRILSSRGEAETFPKLRHTGEKQFKGHFKSLKGSIAWVIGASMVIPKVLFEELKGFDPDFFLYGEDEDLCLRVRKLGYEIGYCFEVTVEHYDAGSERKTTSYELASKKQKALILFYVKHFSPSDVVTLLKRELRQVSMRLFFHQLRSFFHLFSSPESKSRYRAIRDINREFLARIVI